MRQTARRLLCSALLLLASLPAASAMEGDHAQFCENVSDASQTVTCINKELDFHQERLSTLYKDYAAALPPEAQAAFEDNQKKWLAYRDAECAFAAGWTQGQVAARIYELSCLSTLTQERAARIERAQEAAGFDGLPEFGGLGRWMNAIIEAGPTYWNFKDVLSFDTNCDGAPDRVVSGFDPQSAQRRFAIAHAGHPGKPVVFTLSALPEQAGCAGALSLAAPQTDAPAAPEAPGETPGTPAGETGPDNAAGHPADSAECRHTLRFGADCDAAELTFDAAAGQYAVTAPRRSPGPEEAEDAQVTAPDADPSRGQAVPPQKPHPKQK